MELFFLRRRRMYYGSHAGMGDGPRALIDLLTPREREILSLIADQRHNEEIARVLVGSAYGFQYRWVA